MTDVISELKEICGSTDLVVGDDLKSRAASATDSSPHEAIALFRPRSTDQLSKGMAICHKHKQAVVIQGGMTGLVDGATAADDEIAISMERMNTVQSIDATERTITVGAGVTIQTVQDLAAHQNLLFPVDWGARGSAMVGGAIATNAGGNGVLRYGMMRDQVLGLEVVLADGTVLSSMNTLVKNNTGYDLKQLFIGSEGTLGIITRAVLRLKPALTEKQTALVAVDTFDKVIALLGHLESGLAGTLNAFEVMWQEHYKLIIEEGGHQWVLPDGFAYYIVVETSGANAEADAERIESVLGEAMEAELVSDAVICTSVAQRNSVWEIREDVDTFLRVLSPPITFDVSVPIRNMEEYVANVKADIYSSFPHAKGTVFGHLGDGNIHFCWTVGSDKNDRVGLSKIVYDNLQPFHGSVSAEHGIGTAKRKYLGYSRNEEEIRWMERLKRLFDPENLLNPGRIVDIG